MKIFYYTSTGNSLHIAKSIGGELISIPKAIKNNDLNFSDDQIGFVFPLYNQTVPDIVIDFLTKATFKSKYTFAIVTYGLFSGAVSKHLTALDKKLNIGFSYINTIKMVDTYLPSFDIEKQLKYEHKKQIEKQIEDIVTNIEESKKYIPSPSFVGKLATNMMVRNNNKYHKNKEPNTHKYGPGIEQNFMVESSCSLCGTCVKVCPVDNIELDNNIVIFNKNCMSCLSCTHNCPENAIRLKNEKSKTRFRNNHISLKEIIIANE